MSPPPPVRIAVGDAPGLLMGVDQLRKLLGWTDIQPEADQTTTWLTDPDPGTVYDPAECMGVLYNGKSPSYAGTHPLGAYGEAFVDHDRVTNRGVSEMVVLFATAAEARAAAQRQVDQWNACRDRKVSTTPAGGGRSPAWTVSDITTTDGVTTMVRHTESSQWTCARFVADKANVVIDGMLCSYNITDRPLRVAQAIRGRIPG